MKKHVGQEPLFVVDVSLEKRVRKNHPLRRIRAGVDFGFVRRRVAHLYGYNGNESVDPEVLLKLMFLLFYYDVPSERELMATLPERLEWLWFLGYSLDEKVPGHSVLSKARRRWGTRRSVSSSCGRWSSALRRGWWRARRCIWMGALWLRMPRTTRW